MSTPAVRRDRSAWERLSASLQPEGRAIIGGRAVAAADGRVFEDVSPIDGRTIAEVARGAAADVDAAVASARASFESGVSNRGSASASCGASPRPSARTSSTWRFSRRAMSASQSRIH